MFFIGFKRRPDSKSVEILVHSKIISKKVKRDNGAAE